MSDYLDGLYNDRDHINESARMYLDRISRLADRAGWLCSKHLLKELKAIERELNRAYGVADELESIERQIDAEEELGEEEIKED